MLGLIYLMFFLSGAAALIYQVVWVRSLSLIFGGSHLAVTAVLSIFMAGLAIGGYILGRYADHVRKPLRLYGFLEMGIALFSILFIGLMKIYPWLYIHLAQGREENPIYLSVIRIIFSIFALIVPTTLMGGTLPVISRFVSRHPRTLKRHLSFLYGFNTLGAVTGASAAGFYFLRLYSVSTTLDIAILINLLIGLTAILIQAPSSALLFFEEPTEGHEKGSADVPIIKSDRGKTGRDVIPVKLVLWGIGVSGFCALGYEVLWTRILSIVIGASVYGFTIMLAAFLSGIALGSAAYGLMAGTGDPVFSLAEKPFQWSVLGFGVVLMVIGITAFFVTLHIRDLPSHSLFLNDYFHNRGMGLFGARLSSNLILAFSYMILPSFFMGFAFPLAGKVHAEHKNTVGRSVGEVLAYNTLGAILGAVFTGFVLIYVAGIERSLQILILINIGFGLFVAASLLNIRVLNWVIPFATLALILFLASHPAAWRMWDTKYFAIYRTNQPEAFRTPEMVREAIDNTDVLYYAEGVQAIVSSIKIKGGGHQAFLTNGRVEASTHNEGLQCQYTLGHLPMLLHKNPRKVFVLGTGSGMTLGATSVYPSVEKITLAEIEPKVLGVARTFGEYNHHVLDNPKLKIVFNDGRNFLLTTQEKFDIITADPIHPWFSGAGYLYTDEYFKLASEHLEPGGIICQWLPIYELTNENLKSVARTFSDNFRYTMLWLTHDDAELVGSNSPIIIDEAEMQRRISQPEVLIDLKRVMMDSSEDFLSYFVMGTAGLTAYSRNGILNTDNNLYLEFSAPFSIGEWSLMQKNAHNITEYRENILPYLRPAESREKQAEQEQRWSLIQEASSLYDRVHILFLGNSYDTPEFERIMTDLEKRYPGFAPARFLANEYEAEILKNPRLLQKQAFAFSNEQGSRTVVEISAVLAPVSMEKTAVIFVDNDARIIYGQLYVTGADKDAWIRDFAGGVMASIQDAYQLEVETAKGQGGTFPLQEPALHKMKEVITLRIKENKQP
ncbi:MAG: fused MFS/spermidine synthase [bacterium]